jgi:ATP phosphoribosyltransferase regulatory subunit
LFDALQRKAMDEIVLLPEALPAALRKMLRALAELCGGRDVLDLAQACLVEAPDDVHAALDDLLAIADALSLRYPELPLYFDLGELRGYRYHTGVVFAAFVPGVGQSIAQGGRYDDIGADFGRARPATGFSTDLKTLVSLGQMPLGELPAGIWAPDHHDVYLWRMVQRLRGEGERVVQALPGQALADAREVGCDRQLLLCDGRWQVMPLAG